MKTIQKIIYLSMILTFTDCKDYTYLFRQNAQGTYELISDTSVQFTIDTTGSMAGTPQTQMFFYQAVSETEAIYTKKYDNTRHYVPIRLDGTILYYNDPNLLSRNVSFSNMTAFAKKIK